MLCWDSVHELNFYRLAECDARVKQVRDQPCAIEYCLNGIERTHFPDSLVVTDEGATLCEVKTAKEAAQEEVAERTRLLTRLLPHWGYQYRIVLAEDLGAKPRLENACHLLRFGRKALSFELREFFRRIVDSTREFSWCHLVAGRYAPLSAAHACRLVLDGALHINFMVRLQDQSLCVERCPGDSPLELSRG